MRRHGDHRDGIDNAFDIRLAAALSEYEQKQVEFSEQIKGFSRWSIDIDTLTLAFEGSDGRRMEAEVVPVGTYLPHKNSWAWVWANAAYPDKARAEALRIKDLAEVTGYGIFSTTSFAASREEVDELCALSLQHLNGRAVFKIKDDDPWQLFVVK